MTVSGLGLSRLIHVLIYRNTSLHLAAHGASRVVNTSARRRALPDSSPHAPQPGRTRRVPSVGHEVVGTAQGRRAGGQLEGRGGEPAPDPRRSGGSGLYTRSPVPGGATPRVRAASARVPATKTCVFSAPSAPREGGDGSLGDLWPAD